MKNITLSFVCAVLLASGSAQAQYEFLGSVQAFEKTASGIEITCENEVRVSLKFLRPTMFRVTLDRPELDEELLDYPLARTEWDPVEFELAESEDELVLSTAAMHVRVLRNPCRIRVESPQGSVICEDDPGFGIGWDSDEVRCWKSIADDEKFYGLGGKAWLNKRGREWTMWNTDYPAYNNRTDPLYQSIPFLIGMRGGEAYGIYFNNSYRSTFNLGAGNLRYYSFSAEQGPLDYFVIYGPEVENVVERYTEITGRMPMPPLWSLGYQQCRWSYYPEVEVRALAQTFRDKQIPADVIYLDIHYMDDYRVFTWDDERFPKPKRMLSDLADQGFRVVTIVDPGVKADFEYDVAREGLAGLHFVRYPDGQVYQGEVWPGPSYFPDFSRPASREWWGRWIGKWLDWGVAGCWIDMNEPAVWGQAFPTETIFDDNGRTSSHKKMHNLYALLMAQATYDGAVKAKPNERPFLLTRAGFAGEQRYTAVWTGDNVANEEHIGLGIEMVLSQSLSGIAFSGVDLGGFIDTPTPELFARWVQLGSVMPLCRTHTHHGSRDQEPWSFGEDIEDICRQYITYRYALLPYLYSLFHEASVMGTPIWKPLFWFDQGDDRAYDWAYQSQFYVGDELLVAPVKREGQELLKVYLPKGKWLDWHRETVYEGPADIIVDAPRHELPVFLREGAIIPMRDPIQHTGERPIQELTLHVFPSESSHQFTMYEDDGISFDYRDGKYRTTEWSCRAEDGTIEITQTRPHRQFMVPRRATEIRVHGVMTEPMAVTLGGVVVDNSSYDSDRSLLTVRLPADDDSWTLVVE